MRRRILPFIGLSFGLLVLSRAVDVSSEVLPPKVEAAAMIDSDKAAAPNLHAKDQQAEDPQVEDLQVEKSPADALVSQCLTGAILETLSSDSFLREMSSEKAGFIMANMDARRSYTISVIIAGKNANYRKKN